MKRVVSSSDVISQLRLPLIVLVTYAHSYGAVAEGYRLLLSPWDTCEVLRLLVSQTLVKVAVPVFYVISGYLFFARAGQWSMAVYRQKMGRRVKSLLLPYVVWNLLMAAKLGRCSWDVLWDCVARAGMQTDWLGRENWMTAPADMPLWFLRDLMVVSLLTPIIYILLRRFGTVVMGLLTVVYLSGVGAFALPGLSMYAVYFFSLGALLGIRRLDLVATAVRYRRPAYVLTLLLGWLMMVAYGTGLFSPLMLCFRLTGAVATLALAASVLRRSSRRLPPRVVGSSYVLYLAHYVLFMSFIDAAFFRVFGTSAASCSLHYLLCPLVKAGLIVGAYMAVRRMVEWGYRKVS